MRIAGLFAGVGGLDLGLAGAGHEPAILCECWEPAQAVLRARFHDVSIHSDVRTLASLPTGIDVVSAGFPCQDLSQAGNTAGIDGARSGLVNHVFRLIDRSRPPWVLIENVSFMLALERGAAMRRLVQAFEDRGYVWAYRVVNSRAYLPQRRERVYMLASRCCDPADVLFVDEQLPPPCRTALDTHAHGFYWTEGVRGLGWAEDAIPTLKNGSTIGIPSPPAILLPSGKIITPDIRDAERLQGLPENWTEPAEAVARPSSRWTLVGNAVTVDVANWIGNRLSMPGQFDRSRTRALPSNGRWPRAARGDGRERVMVEVTDYPEWRAREPLHQFLDHGGRPLSLRAATGFRSRTKRSRLRFPQGFLAVLDGYIDQIECGSLSSLPAPSSAPTPMVAA